MTRDKEILAARKEMTPILEELRDVGVDVPSLAKLVNFDIDYKAGIPILLNWLPKVKTPGVKDTIIRALTTEWAKPKATPVLIQEFIDPSPLYTLGMKYAICNALSVTADDSYFEDIASLVMDNSYGLSRAMLIPVISKMNNPKVEDILIQLLDDEQLPVVGQALKAIRKKPIKDAEAKIKRYLDHPEMWVRKEAKLAIENIEKMEI